MNDEHAAQRLRRKALDLIDTLEMRTTIRDTRRRLKELRALAVLLGRGKEAAAFRDAGRALGSARNAEAALEAFDRLRDRFASEWTPKQFAKIRRVLAARHANRAETSAVGAVERGRVAAWPIDEMHRDELLDALTKSYRRARRATKRAIHEQTPAAIHTWRKRVKMHWYQSQFLTEAGIVQLERRNEALRKLSRALGQHHDLALIDDLCRREPELFGSAGYVRRFQTFVARELAELFAIAAKLGREQFAQREYARRAGTSTSVHLRAVSKTAAVNFPP